MDCTGGMGWPEAFAAVGTVLGFAAMVWALSR
jgi:hypothetical protein